MYLADDIKENAMSGGTPKRLRGLDANGNSISPTVKEVENAMGIYSYNLELNAGEEKDLGNLGYGIYMINSTTIGTSAIYICGSFKECFVSSGGRNDFSDYADGTKSVVFGRKETNGDFFIKNNLSYFINIAIRRISF